MPDALSSLDAHFEALLAVDRPTLTMSVTIDGACSFCHDRVTGRGADIFEALAAAEVDHFEATKCRGEPVEVSCRVPKRLPWRPLKDFGMSKVDDKSFDEHLAAATAALDHKPPPWSKIKKRPPPPPAQRPVSQNLVCYKCGGFEEACQLNGCRRVTQASRETREMLNLLTAPASSGPPPLPAPDLDLFERIKK